MDYSSIAFLLLALGLALLVAEVFIPSGGMILVVAIICLAGSVWCAWSAWWVDSRTMWWVYLSSLFLLIPVAVGGALFALPRTSFGRRVLLEAPTLEEVTPYARETERLRAMIGRSGRTISLLNPGGLVVIDGERLHSETQGMLLDPGTDIVVVGIKGNRLLVRAATEDDSTDQADFIAQAEDDESPLDFDVPQS